MSEIPEIRKPPTERIGISFNHAVVESHLLRPVEVYRNSGREITNDLLTRFRLMAARADQAARAAGATGGDWLEDALVCAFGVARLAIC